MGHFLTDTPHTCHHEQMVPEWPWQCPTLTVSSVGSSLDMDSPGEMTGLQENVGVAGTRGAHRAGPAGELRLQDSELTLIISITSLLMIPASMSTFFKEGLPRQC